MATVTSPSYHLTHRIRQARRRYEYLAARFAHDSQPNEFLGWLGETIELLESVHQHTQEVLHLVEVDLDDLTPILQSPHPDPDPDRN